jgi:hypothetical protein
MVGSTSEVWTGGLLAMTSIVKSCLHYSLWPWTYWSLQWKHWFLRWRFATIASVSFRIDDNLLPTDDADVVDCCGVPGELVADFVKEHIVVRFMAGGGDARRFS